MTNMTPAMDQFERPDPILTNKIVTHLKSQGIFDQFRRECMADVDTKPAYQNLRQRVEGSVAAFLRKNPWRPEMNKNQLRDNLRKHIQSAGFLDIGVDRIVDQVVNPKIYTVFLPKVEEVVRNCLEMDKDQPTFIPPPPPPPEVKLEPQKFQNKHNLAPRATIASFTEPRMPSSPTIEVVKPPQPLEEKDTSGDGKISDPGSPDPEVTAEHYVADENSEANAADDEDEDDEESPPFERHSQNDRLILGVRTDSSDSNSNDSQVVTSIVDDNLEERLDNNTEVPKESNNKEEKSKKEEESSSDEYVPKTPTINMEGLDGTLIEFNSISEYKQYQTKFDEESFGNVEEEVISSQWVDETSNPVKEEKNSNEENLDNGGLHKRKLDVDNFDDGSISSVDKESASDEGKPRTFSFVQKKFKLYKNEQENETREPTMSNAEIDDTTIEKSLDVIDTLKLSDSEHREKSKSSSSSKDSGNTHRHRVSHKSHKDNTKHYSSTSKEKIATKESREGSILSSNSFKDKTDSNKKSDKHNVTRDRNNDRERKKSESSSSKHNERDSKNKHNDKGKERDHDRRRLEKSDSDKNKKDNIEKDRKEFKHEHKDRSRYHHDKEKKKHDSHDKLSQGKKDHDSIHRHDKDKRDSSKSSKHSHSSNKYSHKSSLEKHNSDKDHKHHKHSSEKYKSSDKKSEKDGKYESKKKQREQCKSSSKDDEGRRSTDRDSNGPSGRSHLSSTSRPSTSRAHTETLTETGERTTSNSDNTVSDNIEALQYDQGEQGIASPDPEQAECSWSESDFSSSEWNEPKEELEETGYETNKDSTKEIENCKNSTSVEIGESNNPNLIIYETGNLESLKPGTYENKELSVQNTECKADSRTDDILQNLKENVCVENSNKNEQDFSIAACSIHDTSSEKENIEQSVNYKEAKNNANATLPVDNKMVKFKKPKIAANIFEVKKIMQARRNLKRMEKKRMKLQVKNDTEESPMQKNFPSDNGIVGKSQGKMLTDFEDESLNIIEQYSCFNLLVKNDTEEGQIQKNSLPENGVVEKSQDDFTGFEEVSSNKIEQYTGLINKISNEVISSNLNNNHTTPNLITSLIDLNPELDEYVETVLKGKVHRNIRVRLPPICDKNYKFDPEQNVYILIESGDQSPVPNEELVDNNLCKVNPTLNVQKMCRKNMSKEYEEHKNSKSNTFNGSESKSNCKILAGGFSLNNCSNNHGTPLQESNDNKNPLKHKINNEQSEINKEETNGPGDNSKHNSPITDVSTPSNNNNTVNRRESITKCKVSTGSLSFTCSNDHATPLQESKNNLNRKSLKRKMNNEDSKIKKGRLESPEDNLLNTHKNDTEASSDNSKNNLPSAAPVSKPKIVFSLTFNQTYDDILKEKEHDSVHISKKLDEEIRKSPPQTVVKITNDNTSEHVFIGPVKSNAQVPRITRSGPVNGNIAKPTSQTKQIPRISRIVKSKDVFASTAKPAHENGIHSATKFKVKTNDTISQQMINDVIGIQVGTTGQDDEASPPTNDFAERIGKRVGRHVGTEHSHCNSPDLNKSLPQLNLRNARRQSSCVDTPSTVTGRKRHVTITRVTPSTQSKRRR